MDAKKAVIEKVKNEALDMSLYGVTNDLRDDLANYYSTLFDIVAWVITEGKLTDEQYKALAASVGDDDKLVDYCIWSLVDSATEDYAKKAIENYIAENK